MKSQFVLDKHLTRPEKYGNIQFVYDGDDADFYVIGNWSKNIEALKGKKLYLHNKSLQL